MKVSIIIPVFNSEKHLKDCLESIINQTYSNLEIICINDCSTDNSLKILKEYEKKDTRIKIIDKIKNEGQMKARNEAYLISTGELIANIDSDDFIEKDTIEKSVELIKKYDVDISIFDLYKIDENNNIFGGIDEQIKEERIKSSKKGFELTLEWKIPCNGVYKRELMEEYNDDINYYNGDELASRKRILSSEKVGISDGKYYYRQHSNSYVHKVNSRVYEQILSDANLRNFSKNKIEETVLEEMEYLGFNKILYFLKRYLEEKNNFSIDEKEKIVNTINKGIELLDKKRIKNYYSRKGEFFRYIRRIIKLKIMKRKCEKSIKE